MYGSSEITASPEQIWSVLCNLPDYPSWNQYTVTVTPKHPTGAGNASDNELVPGKDYVLQYRPKPSGKTQAVPITVNSVDHESFTICWEGRLIPSFLLRAQKVQRVTVIPTSDGQSQSRYEIFETQTGPLAYVVRWLMYDQLQSMTQGIADNLKSFVARSASD